MNNTNITIGCQQAGRFRLQIGKTPDTVHTDTGWFDNVILDSGIAYLLNTTSANMLSYISVGTSDATPDVSQTGLIARVATTNSDGSTTHGYDAAGGYGWTRQSYRFAQGAAAGNLAEVGIGASTNGNNLWSRARILNGSGMPTVLTVTADDFLTVTYELRSKRIAGSSHIISWDTSDGGEAGSTEVNYNEPTYAGSTSGACAIYKRDIGQTIQGSGTSGTVTVLSTPSVNGVKKCRALWGKTEGLGGCMGFTGISTPGVLLCGSAKTSDNAYVYFTNPIPKTNEYEVRVDFDYVMSRWTP